MAEGAPGTINLTLKDSQQHEIQFRVKPTTKFQKIFDAYCQKKGISLASIRFVYDGEHVRAENTPGELDMEDGDTVDVFLEQLGGCRCADGGHVPLA